MSKPAIAIIGTGMAALAFADGCGTAFQLSLFDKSRGLSGRLSTRRAPEHALTMARRFFMPTLPPSKTGCKALRRAVL